MYVVVPLLLLAHYVTALASLFVVKFACFNSVSNIEPVNLLNLAVVIYLA